MFRGKKMVDHLVGLSQHPRLGAEAVGAAFILFPPYVGLEEEVIAMAPEAAESIVRELAKVRKLWG